MTPAVWVAVAVAATPPSVIGLDGVLDRALTSSATLELLRAQVDEAQGAAMAAQGSFDPKLKARGDVETLGKTRSSELYGGVEQRLGLLWGAAMSAGYRNGTAEAVYDGKTATSTYGEAFAKIDVPLLRDGYIDGARTKAEVSDIKREATGFQAWFESLHLARMSADQYLDWKELRFQALVQTWLLSLAETREAAIEKRVKAGRQAEFDLWDNQRLVAERRADLEKRNADVEVAAYKLQGIIGGAGDDVAALASQRPRPLEVHTRFFGPDGARTANAPPDTDPGLWTVICAAEIPDDQRIADMLDAHPYMKKLGLDVRAAERQLHLADNQLLPKVNVSGFVAKDFGTPRPYGDQYATKNDTEAGVGLSFELPTINRKARGARQVARASLRQARTLLSRARLKIEADAHALRVKLTRACAAAQAQARAADLALRIEAGAAQQYALGAVDLLALNLREQQAAGALIKLGVAVIDVERTYVSLWWLLGPNPDDRAQHLLTTL